MVNGNWQSKVTRTEKKVYFRQERLLRLKSLYSQETVYYINFINTKQPLNQVSIKMQYLYNSNQPNCRHPKVIMVPYKKKQFISNQKVLLIYVFAILLHLHYLVYNIITPENSSCTEDYNGKPGNGVLPLDKTPVKLDAQILKAVEQCPCEYPLMCMLSTHISVLQHCTDVAQSQNLGIIQDGKDLQDP